MSSVNWALLGYHTKQASGLQSLGHLEFRV